MTIQHPAAQRRRLTAALRRYRSNASLTQREVAEDLGWSASKFIRIEQGAVGISIPDLRALLTLYKVDNQGTVAELEEMARGSRKMPPPYGDYADVISAEALRYFRYEATAAIIHQVAITVVPGLLQTDRYAAAIFAANEVDPERAGKLLDSRRERRALLDGDDVPEAQFVIDEGALRRRVGGTEVMAQQLDHLAEMAKRKRVCIKVLEFGAGAHPALTGSFNLLEFGAEDDPDVLFYENPTGQFLLHDDRTVTAAFRSRFQRVKDLAVTAKDLHRYLER